MPVTLAGADSPLTSSNRPTAMMIVAASTTPAGSELRANSGSKRSSSRAVSEGGEEADVHRHPPIAGIGSVCTVRSLGSYSHPRHRANQLTNGVTMNVVTPATAPMRR